MNTKDLIRVGVPIGNPLNQARDFIAQYVLTGGDRTRISEEITNILSNPAAYAQDTLRGPFAQSILHSPPSPREKPVSYQQWGEGLEQEAINQMEKACLLPISVAGALMPDAHVGY